MRGAVNHAESTKAHGRTMLTARRNQAGPLRSLTLERKPHVTVTTGWLRNNKYASAGHK